LISVEKQHLNEIAQLEKQTHAEHGEENVQMKAHAYVHK